MSKTDAVRIADTIAFIRTAAVPVGNMGMRATVADILRDRDQDGLIGSTVAPAMSQGSNYTVFGREAAQELRHYRRAIILIRMVLQNSDRSVAPHYASNIADANLPQELGNELAQVHATQADLQAKLTLLKDHPLQFLQQNTFTMVGESTSGVMSYAFSYDPMQSVYQLALDSRPCNFVSEPVDVFHLHVQSYASLAKTARPMPPGGQSLNVVGALVHGADLMVTTQLTGCSVVYHLNGALLVAAHVQPVGINAEIACADLRANATLTQAPGNAITGIFGPTDPKGVDPNNYQKAGAYNYCIGVRSGGTWALYAQQRTPGAGGNKLSWQIA